MAPEVPVASARAQGAELRRRAQGRKSEALQAALGTLDEELAEWADRFVFGDVWSRGGLRFEERRLVAVTALAVGGQLDQLRHYLHGALQDGARAEQLHEALLMTCVYAGFPTAIAALAVLREVEAAERRHADGLARAGRP